MAGVSAEQHLFSGSIFSDCCSPPCHTLEPPKAQSPTKYELESSRLLFHCTNSGKSSSIPPEEAATARKLLAKSLSFGGIDSTRRRGGVSFPDDLSSLTSDGLPPENFLCAIKENTPLVGSFSGTSGSAFESADVIAALQKFLPSNNEEEASWPAVDAYSCDEFRMYEFKVRKCTRGRSHDWTECPFAHPGEKARRRDPRRFHYSGTGCPDFRKGNCRRGDACEFAHGVFECWLHPARYRTQPCKDGRSCRRRVCFFAHTPEQLRLLPGNSQAAPNLNLGPRNFAIGGSYDGSPLRYAMSATSFDGFSYDLGTGALIESKSVSPRQLRSCLYKPTPNMVQISSPTSTLVGLSQSPPSSPSGSPPLSPDGSRCWMTYGSSPSPASEAAYQNSAIQTKVGAGSSNNNNNSVAASSFVGYHRPLNVAARRENIMSAAFVSVPNVDATSPEATVGDYGDLIKSLQHIDLNASPFWQQQQQGNPNPGKSPTATTYNQFGHCAMNVPCARWDGWDSSAEDGMPRVESGRDLRAKIYGRLTKELSPLQDTHNVAECPDLAWVNELVM